MSDIIIPRLLFGTVHLDSRLRADGNRLIGEGRALHYDEHGNLVRDTGWQPTGVEVVCGR